MTRDEVKKILIVIENTFSTFKVENKTQTINVWESFLKDYTYEAVNIALSIYISTSGSAFAPSISQLIGMMRKPQELSAPNEVDVWREVRKAIRNGNYGAETEFEKLSDTAKRMVGEPAQLREWAQLPSEDIDTIIQSNFKKRFETMQKRQAEINAMPESVKKLIQGGNLIEQT